MRFMTMKTAAVFISICFASLCPQSSQATITCKGKASGVGFGDTQATGIAQAWVCWDAEVTKKWGELYNDEDEATFADPADQPRCVPNKNATFIKGPTCGDVKAPYMCQLTATACYDDEEEEEEDPVIDLLDR